MTKKYIKTIIIKSLSICLAVFLIFPYIASNASNFEGYINDGLNVATDDNDVPHPSKTDNSSITTPFIIDTYGQAYASKGGNWVYSYGGPTSTSTNYNYKYNWVKYLSNEQVNALVASKYDSGLWDALTGFGASITKDGITRVLIQKGATEVLKTAFSTLSSSVSNGYALYKVIKLVHDELFWKGIYQDAAINGRGITIENYQYSYNGVWYEASYHAQRPNNTWAYLPHYRYGYGRFIPNYLGAYLKSGSGSAGSSQETKEYVKHLQTRLNQLGYSAGTADGIFGSKTNSAVRSFQGAKGLGVDGVVGPSTWEVLFR